MPLYEYQCASCGDIFEVMQKFSDAPLTQHEKCGGAVERLLSAPALQFKGTGWYITDYARGNAAKSEKDAPKSDSGAKPDSSSSGSGGSASTKSESK
jgi:putative FmdB family regulatory protein